MASSDSPPRWSSGLWRTSAPFRWSPWRCGPDTSAWGRAPWWRPRRAAPAAGGWTLGSESTLCCCCYCCGRSSAPFSQDLGFGSGPRRRTPRTPAAGQRSRPWRTRTRRTAWRSGWAGAGPMPAGRRGQRAWRTEHAHRCWWRRWKGEATLTTKQRNYNRKQVKTTMLWQYRPPIGSNCQLQPKRESRGNG